MGPDLHGFAEQFDFYLLVTKKMKVDNKAPLLFDAEDFGFETRLAKLQELAGLDILLSASATVALTFER